MYRYLRTYKYVRSYTDKRYSLVVSFSTYRIVPYRTNEKCSSLYFHFLHKNLITHNYGVYKKNNSLTT